MVINVLTHHASIGDIKSLYYILTHSKDELLQSECGKMINVLHEKVMLPYMNMVCSFAENSDCRMPGLPL